MKHLIALFISFSFIFANAQSLDEKADQAYSEGDFQQALELYQQAATENGVSSMLYYNMGNTYYRLDSIAKAIGCYERALRLDPKNDDARANIKFINDRYNLTGPEKSAPTIFLENITDSLHPNSWAILSLVLFIILLLDIALYLFNNKEKIRKIAFFSSVLLLIVVSFSCLMTHRSYKKATDVKYCIISQPSVQLSTLPAVPANPSQQAFTVPEGYKLEIIDSLATPLDKANPMWLEVNVTGDSRAWVSVNDVDIIR